MVKAIMHGCNGKMGQVITGLIKADEAIEIVAGIDTYTGITNDYPVFESIEKCDVKADVIIDFSNSAAADRLLDFCADRQIPVVLCTTGLSEEQLAKVDEAAKKVAVLKSANMSLGINLLLKLLQDATRCWHLPDSISNWWKGITTRRWMRPAGRLWHWRILSMSPWAMRIPMYMTGARYARSVTARRSESLRYAAAPSWGITKSSTRERMR